MWEELVVKRYLCAKTAGLLTLEYYLLISLFAEDLEIYGVKIVEAEQQPAPRPHNERPADLSPDCSAFQRDCCADKLGGGIYRGLSFALPGDGGPSMSVERGVSLTIYISTYSFSPSE